MSDDIDKYTFAQLRDAYCLLLKIRENLDNTINHQGEMIRTLHVMQKKQSITIDMQIKKILVLELKLKEIVN